MNPTTPPWSPQALHSELLRRLQTLAPTQCELIDESHKHKGHPGAQGGARHFRLTIQSKQFQGLNALARHRLVLACVQDLMPHPVHALAIQALTPTQGNS